MAEKNDKACIMLGKALEMEQKGKAFYDKAADACKNGECKRVFQTLSADELVHIARINKIYQVLSAGEPWCEDWEEIKTEPDALKAIFREMAKRHLKNVGSYTGDVEAVDTGIEFEAAGIDFYNARLEQAEDPVEKQFLEKMIIEERGHYKALSDVKFYLTDPQGWFRETEKGGLDGA